jgi:hypothetical protein
LRYRMQKLAMADEGQERAPGEDAEGDPEPPSR